MALAFNLNDSDSYRNRGNALTKLHQYDKALVSYDRAIALKPDDADAYRYRGIALTELKQFDKAVIDYDQASRSKTSYWPLRIVLIMLLIFLYRFYRKL